MTWLRTWWKSLLLRSTSTNFEQMVEGRDQVNLTSSTPTVQIDTGNTLRNVDHAPGYRYLLKDLFTQDINPVQNKCWRSVLRRDKVQGALFSVDKSLSFWRKKSWPRGGLPWSMNNHEYHSPLLPSHYWFCLASESLEFSSMWSHGWVSIILSWRLHIQELAPDIDPCLKCSKSWSTSASWLGWNLPSQTQSGSTPLLQPPSLPFILNVSSAGRLLSILPIPVATKPSQGEAEWVLAYALVQTRRDMSQPAMIDTYTSTRISLLSGLVPNLPL